MDTVTRPEIVEVRGHIYPVESMREMNIWEDREVTYTDQIGRTHTVNDRMQSVRIHRDMDAYLQFQREKRWNDSRIQQSRIHDGREC